MEKELQFSLDLAKMDLKGNRFNEAERKYLEVAKKFPDNSIAWCGIGVSKYGQLLDSNTTVDEIFYCFEKAKETNPDSISDIESFVIENSFEMVKGLYENYINTLDVAEEIRRQKALGLLRSFTSGLVGIGAKSNNSSSLYTDFIAIGGTFTGHHKYTKAQNDQAAIENYQTKIINSIAEIKQHISHFISNQSDRLIEFNDAANKIQADISSASKLEQKTLGSNGNNNKTVQISQSELLLSKSKKWKNGSIFSFIFAGIGLLAAMGDPGFLISFVVWFSIGIYTANKSRKLKNEANDLEYSVNN